MMKQNMLDQQRREFMELLTQGLANIRGGVSMVNKPAVDEHVTNGPVPSCPTIFREGDDDSKSHQGPHPPLEDSKIRRNDEPRGYFKYKNFTTFKPSSFRGKEYPIGFMVGIS